MFSSPIRFSTGTRTFSKNTSLRWCPSVMPMIGRTVMPGDFMSISRNEMPSCFLASGLVRTRAKIMSAQCAIDVQIFWPLTT